MLICNAFPLKILEQAKGGAAFYGPAIIRSAAPLLTVIGRESAGSPAASSQEFIIFMLFGRHMGPPAFSPGFSLSPGSQIPQQGPQPQQTDKPFPFSLFSLHTFLLIPAPLPARRRFRGFRAILFPLPADDTVISLRR